MRISFVFVLFTLFYPNLYLSFKTTSSFSVIPHTGVIPIRKKYIHKRTNILLLFDDNLSHYVCLVPSLCSASVLVSGIVTDAGINPSPNVADDFLMQVQDSTVGTFFASLSSRLIGGLIGNILAGVAFKLILDQITPRKDSELPIFASSKTSTVEDTRLQNSKKYSYNNIQFTMLLLHLFVL